MTAAAKPAPASSTGGPLGGIVNMLRAMEIDVRLFGMVVALAVILVGFGYATDGQFLQPVNLLTLSVQAASVAVLAMGMVLIIVSRNIDLSVGSVVGVIGHDLRGPDARDLSVRPSASTPRTAGSSRSPSASRSGPSRRLPGIHHCLHRSALVRRHPRRTAGIPRPRSAIISGGSTQAPDDKQFVVLGGGPQGSLGGPLSWAVGIVICVGAVLLIVNSRRQRQRFGFPVRPMWAEALVGIVISAVTLGGVYIANSYKWPAGLATRYAQEHGITEPPGGSIIDAGIPWPVVIILGGHRGDDVPGDDADASAGTSSRSAATPRRPSSVASTRAGRS